MKVNVFFCDDIRSEEDGRRSYMGVYQPVFKIKESQLLIPKFCLYVELQSETVEDFENAKLILRNGAEVVGEFPFVDDDNRDRVKAGNSFIRIELSISPLVVKAPVVVSASLSIGGNETLAREVKFLQDPETKEAVRKPLPRKKVSK